MLRKTIKYTDFNGAEVEEDFFFHLSKAELVEMEMSYDGGLSEALQKIVAAADAKSIIKEFKNIILSSYGKKSEDGRRFIKNQQLREEFESTEAYSTLFMELVTNTDAAIEFINGIIPQGLAEEAAKIVENEGPKLAAVPEKEVVVLSKEALAEMSPEEAAALGGRIARGEVKIAE
jgi:hypothetical protein